MSYENIRFASEGNTALVTLNRPNRRNALSLALMRELSDCLSEIGGRRDLRVVILAAAGKVFSSGHDLSEMMGRDINEYRNLFDVCTELMVETAIDSAASDRRSARYRHGRWLPTGRHLRLGHCF